MHRAGRPVRQMVEVGSRRGPSAPAVAGALLALFACLVVFGYLVGKSGGEDLDAARAAGAAQGRQQVSPSATRRGYAQGLRAGRREGYKQTYRRTYRAAYGKAVGGQ
jgi:hypothetical protein